jgi:hypothetical protein
MALSDRAHCRLSGRYREAKRTYCGHRGSVVNDPLRKSAWLRPMTSTGVTEESDRQKVINLLAEERQKQKNAGDRI